MVKALHGSTIRPFQGCENAAGKLRQKWQATAGPKFTKAGNGLTVEPCKYARKVEIRDSFLVLWCNLHRISASIEFP